ncbi:MAG: isoprenylcysteine carboxyl methyltransferase, partial [Sulfurimonas sp.]|nr:isoprenylcysteine carboxyl methyltransferase [Sulfurimonas sp.]
MALYVYPKEGIQILAYFGVKKMTPKTVNPNITQAPTPRLWFGLTLMHLFFPLILFVCAGDVVWWQGWGFSILFFLAGIVGRILAEKRHPG